MMAPSVLSNTCRSRSCSSHTHSPHLLLFTAFHFLSSFSVIASCTFGLQFLSGILYLLQLSTAASGLDHRSPRRRRKIPVSSQHRWILRRQTRGGGPCLRRAAANAPLTTETPLRTRDSMEWAPELSSSHLKLFGIS